MKDYLVTGSKVKLRHKRFADAEADYLWQADLELAGLDAAPQLTIPFAQYLKEYAREIRHSSLSRHQFAVETLDGSHIGNCVYYDINEATGEAEVGIMIGNRDYWDEGYGTDAMTTLINHVFCQTKLNRLHLKTLDWNVRAQRCFKKCGFLPCGRTVTDGYSFQLMELRREDWQSPPLGEKKPFGPAT